MKFDYYSSASRILFGLSWTQLVWATKSMLINQHHLRHIAWRPKNRLVSQSKCRREGVWQGDQRWEIKRHGLVAWQPLHRLELGTVGGPWTPVSRFRKAPEFLEHIIDWYELSILVWTSCPVGGTLGAGGCLFCCKWFIYSNHNQHRIEDFLEASSSFLSRNK